MKVTVCEEEREPQRMIVNMTDESRPGGVVKIYDTKPEDETLPVPVMAAFMSGDNGRGYFLQIVDDLGGLARKGDYVLINPEDTEGACYVLIETQPQGDLFPGEIRQRIATPHGVFLTRPAGDPDPIPEEAAHVLGAAVGLFRTF